MSIRRTWLAVVAVYVLAGVPSTAHRPARRIVSLVPSVTECVYAAGAGDHLVGVCRYCDTPAPVTHLPKVGSADYHDVPAILDLHPDLVIGGCCNGPTLLPALRARKVATLRLDPHTLPEIIADIRTLGAATGTRAVAERAAGELEGELRRAEAASVQVPEDRRLRVLIGNPRAGAWLPGPGSFLDDLIRRSGGRNAVTRGDWTSHTAADLTALSPDLVLVPGGTEQEAGTPAPLAVSDATAGWPAVALHRVYHIPSGWVLRPGPRLFRALPVLSRLCRGEGPAGS